MSPRGSVRSPFAMRAAEANRDVRLADADDFSRIVLPLRARAERGHSAVGVNHFEEIFVGLAGALENEYSRRVLPCGVRPQRGAPVVSHDVHSPRPDTVNAAGGCAGRPVGGIEAPRLALLYPGRFRRCTGFLGR
jgi:hypothetical protein